MRNWTDSPPTARSFPAVSVTVTTTAPGLFAPIRVDHEHPTGGSFHVEDDGRLVVTSESDGRGDDVAIYAAGSWTSATITEEAEPEPMLGLATTRQLLDEIRARIEVDGANGGGGLDYRTVDAS